MLRLLLAACTLCFATFAAAQEPPNEDGIGPYRFGMSIEEARATAPSASWAAGQQDSTQLLSGGPPVVMGGRLAASLVFMEDRLHRIVLTGATTGDCTAAVGGMVETLEPLYGAFRSLGPHAVEPGALRAVAYSELGSEVRWREVEGGESFAVSARYGPMYVIVRGVAQAATCRVAVTLAHQADWIRSEESPGPTWAELDAARSLPSHQFERRPTAEAFGRVYPPEAIRTGTGGAVILDCLITERLTLNCRASEETPPDEGFAFAAREVSREFHLRQPEGVDSVIGKRVRIPIRFNVAR